MNDALVWLPVKSGEYTTKSGYALTKLQNTCHGTELVQSHYNWRSCVWNIETSPKLRLFMWRLSNKALSVVTLWHDGALISIRNANSAVKRRPRFMPSSNAPYALIMPALHKPAAATATIHQILEGSKRIINLPPSGIYQPLHPWILWNLWTRRNQLLFENKKIL